MYMKLFRVKDDEYICVVESKSITGDRDTVAKGMMMLGVDRTEVEEAMVQLETNEHHVAEFGINLMFLYSKRIEE
jgi:vacuolar-type H+-ATPase subunit F/Vma7